jgi:hypothetical protein
VATTEIEAIIADLTHALNANAQTHQQCMAAADHARRIAANAAATGLIRIATMIGHLSDEIVSVSALMDDADEQGRQATATLSQIDDETSPREVREHLNAGKQKIESVHGKLLAAAQKANQIRIQVEQVLRGGQPEAMLSRLDVIRQCLVIAAKQGDAAISKINTAIARTGQLGT